MEHWIPYALILGFLTGGVILILTLVGAPRPDAGRRRVWEAVTSRLGGKLFVKEEEYRVRFRWRGLEAILLEGRGIVFEIRPPVPWSAILTLDSTPEYATDRKIRHNNPPHRKILPGADVLGDADTAREFLSRGVVRILEDLGALASDESKFPSVNLLEGLRVQVQVPHDVETLVRLSLLSMQLAQHAVLFSQRAVGIQFTDGTRQAGDCQICGAELEGTLVSCERCATPHHRDCWDYAGRCSTYGCGETKSAGV